VRHEQAAQPRVVRRVERDERLQRDLEQLVELGLVRRELGRPAGVLRRPGTVDRVRGPRLRIAQHRGGEREVGHGMSPELVEPDDGAALAPLRVDGPGRAQGRRVEVPQPRRAAHGRSLRPPGPPAAGRAGRRVRDTRTGRMSDRYEQLQITSRPQWRAWLAEHHASAPGIWAVTFKKADPARYVPYDDLVEEALCFGWVDSQGRGLDEARTQLLFTPRRPNSGWSRPNKLRIERLEAAGQLTPAGVAAIETAKANGAWTALDAVEALIEPEELRAALDAEPAARREWDAFPRSAKRAILEWISTAKRPETRARRIAETAESAARGVRANQ
jgi:uncharacterized protein YdeI (YjbR/CyaY-like superfamily)